MLWPRKHLGKKISRIQVSSYSDDIIKRFQTKMKVSYERGKKYYKPYFS